MSIQKAVVVQANLVGDGSTTSYNLDLLNDPYFVVIGSGGQSIVNWFSENLRTSQPAGVNTNTAGYSATISGTVVTITFVTAPPAPVADEVAAALVEFYVLFD
jgi:hypothetical protein